MAITWAISAGTEDATSLKRLRGQRFIIFALIIGIGLSLRLLWLSSDAQVNPLGEAVNVAGAFATTGVIAEAHGPGTGPTAHLNPIMPVISGLVMRRFGLNTISTAYILSLFSLFILGLTAVVLLSVLSELKASFTKRVSFLSILMLIPLFPSLELVGFRNWEGGISVLLSSLFLLAVIKAQGQTRVSLINIVTLAFISAFILFVSPPLGIAAYVCGLVLLIKKESLKHLPRYSVIVLLILVVVLLPWTVRNWQQFHRFIPLRSNFGLELAIAFHPQALNSANPNDVFQRRLAAIHPLRNPDAVRLLIREGGEAGYSERLGNETKAWIKDHPVDALRLSSRHGIQYYFPPSWFWYSNSKGTVLKQFIIWVISSLGVFAAVLSITSWRTVWTYPAVFALIPSVPYVLVQPILRYYYIVYPFLLLLAVEIAFRGVALYRIFASRRKGILSPMN